MCRCKTCPFLDSNAHVDATEKQLMRFAASAGPAFGAMPLEKSFRDPQGLRYHFAP